MSLELPPDDPWVARGYGQASIEPGERVTTAGEVVDNLAGVSAGVAA
jgi:hypothetical protein